MTKDDVGLASIGNTRVMNFIILDYKAQTLKDDTHTENVAIS